MGVNGFTTYCNVVQKGKYLNLHPTQLSFLGNADHASCVIQVNFDVKDPSFKLDDLLKLELHKFEDEVGEIVDCAQKEEKMEISLVKLKETWGRVEFQFAQFKDTPVFTVKLAEEDFEALEDNQVLVQGMMANRYMNTFKDEILGWNKKLMNVADVNQIMSEIQRTWSYLESLFIARSEGGYSIDL